MTKKKKTVDGSLKKMKQKNKETLYTQNTRLQIHVVILHMDKGPETWGISPIGTPSLHEGPIRYGPIVPSN